MKNRKPVILLVGLLLSYLNIINANTLSIPSQYVNPNEAAAAANDGDTVLIEAGEYNGTGIVATWNQNNLTLQGVNGQAHLNANGVNISNGKAIWVIRGNSVIVDNIEFSNADVPDNNGAGIRYEGSGSLTVKNSHFHDNEMGILTGNLGTEEITIESCEFSDHGKSNNGFSHNIYIGRGAKFTMASSYSHDAYEGHNVKSRADENYILYNRNIDNKNSTEDLASSYLIDLPEGGLSYVIGNELYQSSKAANTSAISYARENTNGPIQTLYFINNTIVNDRNNGIAINLNDNTDGIIINNIFDNFTTVLRGSFSGTFNNNEEGALFVERDNYNFHLAEGSAGINEGISQGSGNGFSLTPVYEYIHPLKNEARYSDGQLDIGAFEFKTTSNAINTKISDNHFVKITKSFDQIFKIDYLLSTEQNVKIEIFNVTGKRVAILIDGKMNAGAHSVFYNAKTKASGTYYCKIKTKEFRRTIVLSLWK